MEGRWGFRGQRESDWSLSTSLDRAVKVEFSAPTASGYYHLDRETEIRNLLFRFQQQAHRYGGVPSEGDLTSWFALMQHYGAPTRLLDWTSSPYVGLYFAAEDEPLNQGGSSAIWAIDLEWLEVRANELLQQSGLGSLSEDSGERADCLNRLLRETEKPIIVRIDPSRVDERIAAQQGFFLCKLLHPAEFSVVLMDMMMHPELPASPVVRKLEVPASCRIDFLMSLRAMNIHRASLFPGLDGFGRSLRLDLELKVKASLA